MDKEAKYWRCEYENLRRKKKKEIEVLIPYSDSKTSATLHDGEVILSESYEAEGTKIRVMADEALYARLRQYIIE